MFSSVTSIFTKASSIFNENKSTESIDEDEESLVVSENEDKSCSKDAHKVEPKYSTNEKIKKQRENILFEGGHPLQLPFPPGHKVEFKTPKGDGRLGGNGRTVLCTKFGCKYHEYYARVQLEDGNCIWKKREKRSIPHGVNAAEEKDKWRNLVAWALKAGKPVLLNASKEPIDEYNRQVHAGKSSAPGKEFLLTGNFPTEPGNDVLFFEALKAACPDSIAIAQAAFGFDDIMCFSAQKLQSLYGKSVDQVLHADDFWFHTISILIFLEPETELTYFLENDLLGPNKLQAIPREELVQCNYHNFPDIKSHIKDQVKLRFEPILAVTTIEEAKALKDNFKQPELIEGLDQFPETDSKYRVLFFRGDKIHYGPAAKQSDPNGKRSTLFASFMRSDEISESYQYDVQFFPPALFLLARESDSETILVRNRQVSYEDVCIAYAEEHEPGMWDRLVPDQPTSTTSTKQKRKRSK